MSDKMYTSFLMDWDHILLSYYEGGNKYNQRIKLKPSLYVPSALENPEYKSWDGKPVMRVDFDSVKEARNFVKSYEGTQMKIYGTPHFHYAFIHEHFKDQKPDLDMLKILNFDIELDVSEEAGGYPNWPAYADREINAVTLKLFGSKDIFTFSTVEYKPENKELLELIDKGYKIHYKQCEDERHILHCLWDLWNYLQPDVVTGWNIRLFDVPYIIKRAKILFGDDFVKKLSPFGKVTSNMVTIFGKENEIFEIYGIPTLDYMEIYKKFLFGTEESFSLDYLSNKHLGKSKLDYSKYGNLGNLWKKNPVMYIDYNIIDVVRVEEIDSKLKYMNIAFEVGYETLTNFNDSMTTIRVWDTMVHNYLIERNQVVPFSSSNFKERSIAGGYVKEPQIGKYKWVMSFDFASLYPHLAMAFNISPDTYLGTFKPIYGATSVDKIIAGELEQYKEELIKQDVTISGCGTVFTRKRKGFIPILMESLFARRKEHQAKEDHHTKIYASTKDEEAKIQAQIYAGKSLAIKIVLNSGFGALSNEFYRFFSDNLAESFTLSGQLSTKTVESHVNMRMNEFLGTENVDYVVAADTDSCYFRMDEIVAAKCGDVDPVDFLEEFSNQMQAWIQEALEKVYEATNVYDKKLKMSLESIGPAIWVAKKRYVMSLPSYKKIRYNPPKIKIMGIEAIRTTTPKIIRDWIKDAIPILISSDDATIKKYIDDKWDEFTRQDFSVIAMPKGTNDLEKYSDKNTIYGPKTPLHVRGALLYNDLIKKNNWDKELDVIKSGDKVKTMYLKLPNPLMENAISIPEELPAQFAEFKDYIDYETQFDKVFLDPLKRLTNAAGFDLSENLKMDSFYG